MDGVLQTGLLAPSARSPVIQIGLDRELEAPDHR
jgi:hypothetical protein